MHITPGVGGLYRHHAEVGVPPGTYAEYLFGGVPTLTSRAQVLWIAPPRDQIRLNPNPGSVAMGCMRNTAGGHPGVSGSFLACMWVA